MNNCMTPFKNNTHLYIILERVQQQLPCIKHNDKQEKQKKTEWILLTNHEKHVKCNLYKKMAEIFHKSASDFSRISHTSLYFQAGNLQINLYKNYVIKEK